MNLSALFEQITQEQQSLTPPNTELTPCVRATTRADLETNTTNTANTEINTAKVLITVYTPLGKAMTLYADNQEQADFMLKMNPPPDKTGVEQI